MKKILYAIGIIIFVIACYFLYIYWALGKDSVAQPIVGENLEGEADTSRMTLNMTTWRWQNAFYNDGREIRPKKFGTFTLTFNKNGTFSATTDCNSVGGKYTPNDKDLLFTDIFSTEMYCEGSQEIEFIQLLNNANSYHFTSRGELILNLKFDSGYVIFR